MSAGGLNVVFTGGGTGGHIEPIVSLIQYGLHDSDLRAKCNQIYRIGERGSREQQVAERLPEVRFIPIFGGKLRRYWTAGSTLQNLRDVFYVCIGFFQAIYRILKLRVDIIFCKGGYVALPVCLAGYLLKRKILLHESDFRPGLTNRVVSSLADRGVFTGFPDTFPESVVVGQIFSEKLALPQRIDLGEIDLSKTNLLVMGGSQGASVLFELVSQILSGVDMSKYNLFVLLGTKNLDFTEKFSHLEGVWEFGYLDQPSLAYLYTISDIALTRAGVTSLAEQELFGIKKIIVPTPYTGSNHQWHNGLWYAENYNDILLDQDEQLAPALSMFLRKFAGWKKKGQVNVTKEQLVYAKKMIWQNIV